MVYFIFISIHKSGLHDLKIPVPQFIDISNFPLIVGTNQVAHQPLHVHFPARFLHLPHQRGQLHNVKRIGDFELHHMAFLAINVGGRSRGRDQLGGRLEVDLNSHQKGDRVAPHRPHRLQVGVNEKLEALFGLLFHQEDFVSFRALEWNSHPNKSSENPCVDLTVVVDHLAVPGN